MIEQSNVGTPTPAPIRPAIKPKRGISWINVLLGAALFAAVGGLAFAAGRLTAPAVAAFPNGGPGDGQFPGGGNFQGGPGASFVPGVGGPGGGLLGAGGLTIEGTVESIAADTMTIRTNSGQTVEVSLPSDTTYHQQIGASGSDVQAGSTVRVQVAVDPGQGQGQDPGSLSASDVTVVP